MAFATLSDPVLRLAAWAGLASLAASAAMLVAVALLRLRHARRTARERAARDKWQQVLEHCLVDEPAALPPLEREEAYVFLRLWNRMHEALRGEVRERLNELALRLGAERLAVEYLDSGELRKVLIAIMTLGNLRAASARARMAQFAMDRLAVVSLRAAQALLRIEPDALPEVLAVAAVRVDWPLPRLASMLSEAGTERLSGALAGAIVAAQGSENAEERLPRLLKLAEAALVEVLRPSLRRVLESTTHIESIAAALAALRHPEDIDLPRAFASHPSERVRAEAARALGRLGTPRDLPRLHRLLADPSWWVRHHAANALVSLPGLARAQLEQAGASLTDRFAADAVRQALAERAA